MADAIRKGRRDGTVHLGSCRCSSSRTPGLRHQSSAFGVAGLLLIALRYGLFVLGFKMTWGPNWWHAVAGAAASIAITAATIWFVTRMGSTQE